MVFFLIAGVLYSANRSQDLLFYGTEKNEKAVTEEADTMPESDEETEDGIAAISEVGQDRQETVGLTEEPDQMIRVHVCGAVKQAGVYLLEQHAIVEDAVKAAGGVTKDGAGDYLNLADTIYDGEKIYVPFLKDLEHPFGVDPVTGKADPTAGGSSGTGDSHELGKDNAGSKADASAVGTGSTAEDSQDQGRVNINTAGKEELMTLPGIGETRGEAILSYREEQGRFSCIEDIMKVSGIKEGAFRKIKDRITV